MGLVRLTATLAAPVVVRDDLHLDGLLAAAHPACQQSIDRGTPATALVIPPLPIATPCLARVRAALASVAIFPSESRITGDHTVRRRDAIDIEALQRPLSLGVGPGKNRMIHLPTVVAPRVEWYAIGNRREILRLARRLNSIGSWRSAGYGLVSAWDAVYVEDVDPTIALVDADGVAQRHLPREWVAWADAVVPGPIRPPYWHPARQTAAIVRAGTRCELLPGVVEAIHAAARPATMRAIRERKDLGRAARRVRPDDGSPPQDGSSTADAGGVASPM